MENYVKYRRDLHKIPETYFQEVKTSAYIKNVLKDMPCKVIPVAQTGLLAFFDNGKEETIAFRSDIDALGIKEEGNPEYKSTHEGAMHACGHDGHMAMLLSLADHLAENYKKYKFNVVLIFQPAEESIGGAKPIIESGELDKMNISKVYGFHVWPEAPIGTITTKAGPLMARTSEVSLHVSGKSAHVASAELGVDANEVLAHIICDAYEMRAKELPEGTLSLLRFGTVNGGVVRNILADKAEAFGSVRAFDDNVFDYMMKRLDEICKANDEKFGSHTEIVASEGYPAIMNDEKLFNEYKEILKLANVNFIEREKPHMTAEDFAFYQKKWPGVFAFVGLGNAPALHNNKFDFDEKALKAGIDTFIALLEYYNNK